MNSEQIKLILSEQRDNFLAQNLGQERVALDGFEKYLTNNLAVIVSGLRRSGKSIFLRQIVNKFFADQTFFYINFEDERLAGFKAEDFNKILELLIELYGDQKTFFVDEIQNVERWELFTRRLIDIGYKFFITGSNAELLSKELGSRLTGRYLEINLFPFSFSEFLAYRGSNIDLSKKVFNTSDRAKLKSAYHDYIQSGSIPYSLVVKNPEFNQMLYTNIIYRDVISRYKIESETSIRQLGGFLAANISSRISYNKLKQYLHLKSLNTVKNYISHLESAWLFFTINIFDPSIKRQQIAAKKIYCIDSGIVNVIAFSVSKREGQFLENFVFLHLRRKYSDIYYYQTTTNQEVDFFIPEKKLLYNVCFSLDNQETYAREINSLKQAMEELKISEAYIISYDQEDLIKINSKKIHVLPVYKFAV